MNATIVVAIKNRMQEITAELQQLHAMLKVSGADTPPAPSPSSPPKAPTPRFQTRPRRRVALHPRGSVLAAAYRAAMSLQAHGQWTPAQLKAHMNGVVGRGNWSGVYTSIQALRSRGIVQRVGKGTYETRTHAASALPPSVATTNGTELRG